MDNLVENIREGKIFIYPTDTIYGLGCDAFNRGAVERIKEIKGREKDKPLSVIAPSFEWIKENLVVGDLVLEDYLPGKYTLILKKKDKGFLDWVSNEDSLGVRIPKSDFCDRVREVGVPFITTSLNKSGEEPVISVKGVGKRILDNVDIVIDEGVLNGRPSTLIVDGKEVRR